MNDFTPPLEATSARRSFRISMLLAILCGAAPVLNAHGAATDLASTPLVTSPTASVLPNVFLMLDDSGSMGWDYMPDKANFSNSSYGAASSQCNGVFYDPNITYTPPVDSNGVSYANSSFSAALDDGYNPTGTKTNLSTSFPVGTVPAFYYKYTGTQNTARLKDYYNTSSTFYQECNSAVGSAPGSGVFTKVVVSSTSGPGGTDETTNFANWWSYYHTRMLMMKTATGLAFKTIGNTFRVGFGTLNNNKGSDFLNLDTFNSGTGSQKEKFYGLLYGATPNSSTPLREALAEVGQLYANKITTFNTVAVVDPIQYSCQQNFTILSTDGFWNGSVPTSNTCTNSTNCALAAKLTAGNIGNQDGLEPRPMYDGALTQTTTTQIRETQQRLEKSTVQMQRRTQQIQAQVSTLQQRTTQVQRSTMYLQKSTKSGGNWGSYQSASSCTWGSTTRCRYATTSSGSTSWTASAASWSNAASCTVSYSTTTTSGTNWSGNGTNCRNQTSAWTNASSCTVSAPNSSGNSTQCQYSAAVWTNVASCTPVAPSPGPTNYTVASAVLACQIADTGWVGISPSPACTPGTNASTGQTIDCQTVSTGPTPVASCTQAAAGSGNNWTQTTCNVVTIMASQGVASCTPSGPTSANGYVGTSCTTNTVGPVTTTGCVPATASISNNWTTTTCSSSAGTFDTLADVAEYYYVTDLRTSTLGNQFSGATGSVNGTDVGTKNNVPSSNLDTASWQHMTTFTLGLGARGKMVFDPSYQTATSGDFYSVWQGSTANPGVGVCSWQSINTTCNWPIPGKDKPENIDDLWHAAVNGRGTYFSAANPSDLSIALSSALAGVSARKGSAAAATTSTAFITQGDNYLFHSSFVSLDWTGELTRQRIDLATAKLSAADWSAQTQLDALTPYTNRKIYFFKSSTASKLDLFSWANLNAAQQSYFALANLGSLAQFCITGATCLSSADKSAAAGSPLVEYIKGDRSNEGALADNTKYYRARKHLLGDIVDSESFYVKGALSSYSDPGYSAYQSSMLSRTPTLYVGANDGMLHAVNAASGNEAWAFIPSAVMSNLYRLADKGYDLKHQFYVDGSPQAADIYTGTEWKTILVGGLNNGGQGYYALDITDPANPKGLWEFTDPNLGYTYGNPLVVKLKDGTWVVLLTSGYNNADGLGHLFVVNAATGLLIRDITTSAGTPANPSGLSRIDLAVAAPGVDATVQVVYGGDYQGNLWRFDVNGDLGASGYDAQLLVSLQDGAGNAQPITARPLLSKVGTTLVVYVGTGSFLGVSDQTNISQQSFYAIKDTFPAGTTPSVAIYGNPRSSPTFVQQTITLTPCPVNTPPSICTAGTDAAISSSNPVDWGTKNGWYFDFPHTGERNNTDPAILMGTLVFTSNIPKSDACSVGGDSWVYVLDYKTGGAVSAAAGTGVVGRKFGNELASRPIVITFGAADGGAGGGGGGGGGHICVQGSAGNDPECPPLPPNWVPGTPRRAAWRPLINDK